MNDYQRPMVRCQCGWAGPLTDLLLGYSPFVDDDIVKACPSCRVITQHYAAEVEYLCQTPGCDRPAVGGNHVGNGEYALVCDEHWGSYVERRSAG